MSKFYGLAATKEGKNQVVYLQETLRPKADREAKEKCAIEGLTFQAIWPESGKEVTGSTLTKFARGRKQRRV